MDQTAPAVIKLKNYEKIMSKAENNLIPMDLTGSF